MKRPAHAAATPSDILRACLRHLLLWFSLTLAGTGAAQPASEPPAAEIVLGQTASFTGSFASQAASYRDGALAYFAAVNARGGVHGRRIRLVSLDDGYAVDRALANARHLIEEQQALALFNCMWTNTVQALVPLAENARVPLFAPYTGYEALYARHSPQVFTTRASFSDELNHLLRQLRTLGVTRIGLVHYDSPSGRELLADTQRRMASHPQALSAVGTMKTGSQDPAEAMQALRHADLQALILGISGSDAVAFIRAFEPVHPGRMRYYARSLIGLSQLVQELGPRAEGVSVTQTAPNPHKDRTPVATEYRDLLRRLDPALRPDYIGLEGMIAAKVMVEALRRAGPNPDRAALVRSLERMSAFDAGGYVLGFGPQQHHGSRYVDIAMVGTGGRIVD